MSRYYVGETRWTPRQHETGKKKDSKLNTRKIEMGSLMCLGYNERETNPSQRRGSTDLRDGLESISKTGSDG